MSKGVIYKVNLDDRTNKVIVRLSGLGEIKPKIMYGGVGLFLDNIMFAKLSSAGELYFRVDETTQSEYKELGSTGFYSKSKKKGMPYFVVPEEIQNNDKKLEEWANKVYRIAVKYRK